MGQGREFSDEFINAFVDDQLIPEEKARVCVDAAFDEAFNRRVCELRRIRDLIRLAYADLPKSGLGRVLASVRTSGATK